MSGRRHEVVELLGPESVRLVTVDTPLPRSGELVVDIVAATTCGTDVKVFRRGGHPRMLTPPCPFGHEFAGIVAEVGSDVSGWKPGDRVVVANSSPCGECRYCAVDRENLCADLQYLNGAFGSRIVVPERFVERSMYRVPDDLELEVASLCEPLACVLHGIDACDLDSGSFDTVTDVVVYGSGPIGLLFVGALVSAGHRVVVADPNPPRLAVANALGAFETIEIERGGAQVARVVESSRDRSGFDVAIDATGAPAVWGDALASVRPGGLVNLFGGCAPGTTVPLDTQAVHYSEVTIKGVYHHRPATFLAALDLLSRQAFDARLLLSADRGLSEIAEALRSMMRKEALKVVIRP